MEKNVIIVIFKDNGDIWDLHNNVPRSSFRIENGFVIIDLGEKAYMYAIHKIGHIKVEEV